MEGGPSSSAALLLLVLMLAASSTNAAAAVQRRRQAPQADGSYKLITVLTSRGDKVRLAVSDDNSSIVGFANGKNYWFNVQGTEEPMEPLRSRYGGASDIPGHGLVNLLGTMLKKNATP